VPVRGDCARAATRTAHVCLTCDAGQLLKN
jgi:hypothetical protein